MDHGGKWGVYYRPPQLLFALPQRHCAFVNALFAACVMAFAAVKLNLHPTPGQFAGFAALCGADVNPMAKGFFDKARKFFGME